MEKMTTVTKQRKSKIFKWIFCNLCTIKMNGCSTEFLLLSCKHVFCRNCINKKNQANNATFDKFKCPYCAELSDFKIISADMKDTYLQMFDGQSLDSYREVLEVIAFQYEKCKNKINIILKNEKWYQNRINRIRSEEHKLKEITSKLQQLNKKSNLLLGSLNYQNLKNRRVERARQNCSR